MRHVQLVVHTASRQSRSISREHWKLNYGLVSYQQDESQTRLKAFLCYNTYFLYRPIKMTTHACTSARQLSRTLHTAEVTIKIEAV